MMRRVADWFMWGCGGVGGGGAAGGAPPPPPPPPRDGLVCEVCGEPWMGIRPYCPGPAPVTNINHGTTQTFEEGTCATVADAELWRREHTAAAKKEFKGYVGAALPNPSVDANISKYGIEDLRWNHASSAHRHNQEIVEAYELGLHTGYNRASNHFVEGNGQTYDIGVDPKIATTVVNDAVDSIDARYVERASTMCNCGKVKVSIDGMKTWTHLDGTPGCEPWKPYEFKMTGFVEGAEPPADAKVEFKTGEKGIGAANSDTGCVSNEEQRLREVEQGLQELRSPQQAEVQLRDHYAMAALTGLLASCDGPAWGRNTFPIGDTAYEYADQMLKARSK